ncbi:MAG: hypothetical protein IKU37_07350 [Candidatus Gastranaerophilales bacterium]|nr:hypothetical protein [Candidatus Gastranaerophilales bacterium]
MQESLLNTVCKLQKEPKINVEELEVILNSDIEEVVTLCKKACVKPKTDDMGNAYFTKSDVDMLKKIKQLYSQSKEVQNQTEAKVQNAFVESAQGENIALNNPNKKINFLEKAKNRAKTDVVAAMASVHPATQLASKLEAFENNLVNRMSELLSEKMDGFDEIIVELIRAKTENENLRQQVNSLNKQVFILKNELASFNALPFGFYTKKDIDSL